MGRKKKFIDRKNAVTFRLVHRSQQDPLVADETAPEHVLLEVAGKNSHKAWGSVRKDDEKGNVEKRREEQRKYGVFFDDDYNYLQHLKVVSEPNVEWEPITEPNNLEKEDVSKVPSEEPEVKFTLPSSVFASEVEEEVGLLNKAAPLRGPQIDWDPDVVAALDDDFDFDDPENELEDDFILQANAKEVEDNKSKESSCGDANESDADSELTNEQSFADEETRSRFTNYSLTSSVMRRNEQLTLLDERFETLYEQYDETEIGPLDTEDIEGYIDPNSDLMMRLADEFQKERALEKPSLGHKINLEEESTSEDEMVTIEVEDEEREKWDCQSILSTYSNLYNHPKVVDLPPQFHKIKLSRSGVAIEGLPNQSGLTRRNLQALDDETNMVEQAEDTESLLSRLSRISVRPEGETPEQRRERKREVRELRRERRMEKRANTTAFKLEKEKQEREARNAKHSHPGIKL
ncbi:unnamed protein product [Darwinula stevensoni]|uniref:Protein LTV1 homolog n=1 Tax=Darwinula stevensoni TaxID=69355 RepID=A0A7R8X7Y2_9CRUS|nr:unnamed protein product [Darwinula stevensoni]CAG0889161.1 unnamed protein product [Darwinula stevensoni]